MTQEIQNTEMLAMIKRIETSLCETNKKISEVQSTVEDVQEKQKAQILSIHDLTVSISGNSGTGLKGLSQRVEEAEMETHRAISESSKDLTELRIEVNQISLKQDRMNSRFKGAAVALGTVAGLVAFLSNFSSIFGIK